jgi:DNA-binding LacI/PurR family transcriptional regulator
MTFKKLKSIDELAQLAGVAKSTVSRALNDSPLVNAETKARILELARLHDFQPSVIARNLSLRSSRTIAFVTHAYDESESECGCAVSDPFSLEIMGGIAIGLHEHGYDLLVVHIDPDDRDWAGEYLGNGRVDGFILMTSTKKKRHIDSLLQKGAPFIVWGTSSEDYCTVAGDDRKGGRLAAGRFLALGRKRPAFLGGPRSEVEVQARHQGFLDGLAEGGLSLPAARVAHGTYTEASGARAMEELLERDPGIDAVFSNSDLMAVAALRVLAAKGRRVPEDVAVIGYDNLSIASYTTPALTTISQNIPLAGRLLARDMVAYLENRVVSHTMVPVELVVRASG